MKEPKLPLGGTSDRQLADVQQAKQKTADNDQNYAAAVWATRNGGAQ